MDEEPVAFGKLIEVGEQRSRGQPAVGRKYAMRAFAASGKT